MFYGPNNFETFAELEKALKHCVDTLNRRGVAAINGLIDYDIPYTVNDLPGMASIFRTSEGWIFTTEI